MKRLEKMRKRRTGEKDERGLGGGAGERRGGG